MNAKLYKTFDFLESEDFLNEDVPTHIVRNINPHFSLRVYQEQAFRRFRYYHDTYKAKHNLTNNHLLFQLATGAGKTLLMAGLILELYARGYRQFIFFVDSKNIVEKTKQNFIGAGSSKFLFAENIQFGDHVVPIKAIDTFEDSQPHAINIIFTTINGLHFQLNSPRENALTFDDFKNQKVVLLADEAHHLGAMTKKQGDLDEVSWEKTVKTIYQANPANHLLEFTATAETDHPAIAEKYHDKLIQRYDFKQFRHDGFSKTVYLVQTQGYALQQRMLLAVLMNQYRQEIASQHGLAIKPVMLFKSKTIKASREENHPLFNEMIEKLTIADLQETLRIMSAHPEIAIYQQIVQFFSQQEQQLSLHYLVDRIRLNFSADKTLNANDEKEVEAQQMLLHHLEDPQNRIRVVFAVDKLNEGWDVLNLFDIVKLYETPTTKQKPPTTQERQLIGRGARYCPFTIDERDRYTRKYNPSELLSVLEALHFHSADSSRFIEELNNDLHKDGIADPQKKEYTIKLKDAFLKKSRQQGYSFFINQRQSIVNLRAEKLSGYKDLFGYSERLRKNDEGIRNISGEHTISGELAMHNIDAFDQKKVQPNLPIKQTSLTMAKVPDHIFRKAVYRHPYFTHERLHKNLGLDTVGQLKIDLAQNTLTLNHPAMMSKAEALSPQYLIQACSNLLENIAQFLQTVDTDFIGSSPTPANVDSVFAHRVLMIDQDIHPLSTDHWPLFAQEKFLGNSEEEALVRLINAHFADQAGRLWLLRNEGHFRIFRFEDGKGFAPDFLMLHERQNETARIYQLFLEPKGEHLKDFDEWKESFMETFAKKCEEHSALLQIKVIPMPFFNSAHQTEWLAELSAKLTHP